MLTFPPMDIEATKVKPKGQDGGHGNYAFVFFQLRACYPFMVPICLLIIGTLGLPSRA